LPSHSAPHPTHTEAGDMIRSLFGTKAVISMLKGGLEETSGRSDP
jgi:hypothetical protein